MTAAPGSAPGPPERGFFAETWIWWLLPLVIVAAVVGAVLYFSEGQSNSQFIYDEH